LPIYIAGKKLSIALYHLRVESNEFVFDDDIVINSGSPEHIFRRREEIDHYFTNGRNTLSMEGANGELAKCYK